ncbi:MAG TPA: T9SS type A sorting domain-containing protein, partial [Calditrichia bacterium]|nr:T9SS type A sorting domain-containing protein [Calditrichia bacterium]
VVFPVVNSDMGNSNFQICWYFSGDTENIIDWYFDDIVIRHMDAHDILVESMRVDDHYEPGEVVRPRAKLVNMGANRDTVDVSLSISVGGTEVFSEVQTINGLGSGYSSFATFSNFTAAEPNELYTYRVISHLATDTNPANDTLVGNFDTYTNERQLVLMEIGTGTWCQFCPGSAMGADDMIHNGHNVAIIEYHKAVNGGPDPFDNLYSTFRVNYYSISGFPTTVFDGVERIVGGSTNTSLYPSYLARYNQRIPIKTPFTIDIGGSGSGSNYNVDVRINKMAPVRDTQDNLALHMVLTESHIRYTWRGIDSLHFVAREMYPDFNGMSIDLRAVDSLRISRSLNLNSSWVGNNCELVVFIQDRNTKEVLQTNKVALRNLQPLTGVEEPIATLPATARLLGNYPNPFNPGTTIAYELAHNADMEISIYNLLGQKVRTLVKGNMPAGPGQVTWNGTDQNGLPVASGIYLYRLESENRVFTRKMVLLK